jgi:1-acyl-sn-glycerol-3-phosphate acyltransferase
VSPAYSWQLGPRVPQTHRPLFRRLGLWVLQIAGWRFDGALPDLPKFVLIVAHHTSNWDFPIGLAAKWAWGLDVRWLGKASLFRGPLGWFMRANGGVPVDRTNRGQLVEQTTQAFTSREQFVLVLAPEGTRQRVTEWRSGFWHVAKAANVPIVCVGMDWGRKVLRLGPTVMADEDDAAVGIARVRGYFDDVRGYHPENQT